MRFVEDDWEHPALGAWGLGWEVWAQGMEVTQFTYFQQCGGLDLPRVSCELTYGLERLALYLQEKESVYDLVWAGCQPVKPFLTEMFIYKMKKSGRRIILNTLTWRCVSVLLNNVALKRNSC